MSNLVGVAAAEPMDGLARSTPLQPDRDSAIGDRIGQIADARQGLRAEDLEAL